MSAHSLKLNYPSSTKPIYMRTLSNTPNEIAALEQAAEWFAILHDEPNQESIDDWKTWLQSSDKNRTAWRQIEKTAKRFQDLRENKAQSAMAAGLLSAQQNSISRRELIIKSVLLGLVTTGVIGAGRQHPELIDKTMAFAADERTSIGAIREILLPDKTKLWLNTNSAVNIEYTDQRRLLKLVSGEIYIDTAKDIHRQFFAKTRHGLLQALGTEFNVRQFSNYSELSVFEGAVEIQLKNSNIKRVDAGGSVTFDENRFLATSQVSSTQSSWIQGLLVAENMPLSQLIEELRRHHHEHIFLASELENLRVMGTYPLTHLDKSLQLLGNALPIETERRFRWFINITAK